MCCAQSAVEPSITIGAVIDACEPGRRLPLACSLVHRLIAVLMVQKIMRVDVAPVLLCQELLT